MLKKQKLTKNYSSPNFRKITITENLPKFTIVFSKSHFGTRFTSSKLVFGDTRGVRMNFVYFMPIRIDWSSERSKIGQ